MPDFDKLQANLIKLHKTQTLREISEDVYDSKVTYGVIDRCIKGKEPQDNEIRKRLGLPLVVIQYKDPTTGRFVKG